MMCATFRFHGSDDPDSNSSFTKGEYYTGEEDKYIESYYILKDDNGDDWAIDLCDKEFEVYDIFPK